MAKLLAFIAVLSVLILNSETGSSERVLSISMMSSKSHKNVYEPLLVALANKDHQVTIVSPIKSSLNHKNIREIMGVPYDELIGEEFNFFEMKEKKVQMNPFVELIPTFQKNGKKFLELPHIQSILKEKFDLVIFSGFMNEAVAGILPVLGAPYIITTPFAVGFWILSPVGTPVPMSFAPNVFYGYSDRMSFFQRVNNVIAFAGFTTMFDYSYFPKMQAVYREVLGQETPSIAEILKNASLVLSNSHFSLNFPRPLLPDVIDVGGMHCRPSKPVPKDLDDFLTGSGKDGFIYFSMGSVVKGDQMPAHTQQKILNVFSKLKQRVLWKWESETMEGLPKNVKLSKWLPQQDILGHKNIRLFITHGGLLSTEEAIYHGVPLLGFPMFGDQEWNMKHSENLGFALSRDIFAITEDELLNSINQLLNEKKFDEKVKSLSKIFRDRPQNPLDTAVYWTEYIIKHKGAPHLRSAARDLNTFQYHSLDVIAFLLVSVFAVLYIVFALIRFVFRKVCGSSSSSKKEKQGRHAKRD